MLQTLARERKSVKAQYYRHYRFCRCRCNRYCTCECVTSWSIVTVISWPSLDTLTRCQASSVRLGPGTTSSVRENQPRFHTTFSRPACKKAQYTFLIAFKYFFSEYNYFSGFNYFLFSPRPRGRGSHPRLGLSLSRESSRQQRPA